MKYFIILQAIIIPSISSYAQTSSQYFEKGKHELDLKNFEAAIDDFGMAIKLNTKNEVAYVDRALCRMTRGEWVKAIPDCNKALSLNPSQAVAYFVRGCAKANLKRDGCDDLHKSLQLGFTMAQKGIDQFCH
jgi:tetratricopeptide (TPR) repeat protein